MIYSNKIVTFKCPVFNKNYKTYKEKTMYGSKNKNKPAYTVPEKDLIVEIY